MIRAIVGANWGDEGKGKLTDVFAAKSDIVIRFQGGNNAGHTIINDQGKFALHMLPSGVFYNHTTNVIGNGVALNIPAFIRELKQLNEQNIHPRVIVSDRAQIVMSYHILADELEEKRLGKNQFGSTKSGIAPFYADKYAKIGFQVCELFDTDWLKEKIDRILPRINVMFRDLYGAPELNQQAVLDELLEYRDLISPYVKDIFSVLERAYSEHQDILLEGQLGALRDPDFGIYPYTTSSHTLGYYGPIGAGLPHQLDEVWAVTKAYSSCVGAGPFISELFGDEAEELRRRGGDAGEYGATTGRPRRVGWFDAVATRYGCKVQGATHVALTNIDVLSYLERIPVVTAYEERGEVTRRFGNFTRLLQSKPFLTWMDGWQTDISEIESYDDLPEACKQYIDFLETQIETPIALVSNGPKRSQLLVRRQTKSI